MKLATKWRVKIVGSERSIKLLDANDDVITGDARWEGDFDCSDDQLTSLAGAPKEVGGSFYCDHNQLTTLAGAPKEIGGDFYCRNNQLTSLAGAPKEVGGGFYCSNNQLTSLAGAPKEVGGDFYCRNNQLTSLAGAPKEVGGDFYCHNNQLTSLAGAPKEVGGGFDCYNNQLTSLTGAPKEVGGDFDCRYNRLTTLAGAPEEVGGNFYCKYNQLTTLAGAPKEVGGSFYCYNNQLTTLADAPKERSPDVISRIFKAKLKRGYLLADGILQRVISKRKAGRLTIFKARSIGSKKTAFVVFNGKTFSHGKTLREAKESLMYKLTDRDTTKYQSWKPSDVKPLSELVQSYRAITGACEFGVKEFVSGLKKKPVKLKVSQVFELTEGKYGSEQYKQFFIGVSK